MDASFISNWPKKNGCSCLSLFDCIALATIHDAYSAHILLYMGECSKSTGKEKKIIIIYKQLNEMRCSATNNGKNFKYLTLLPYCFICFFFCVFYALNLTKKRAELYCFCVNAKCNTDNSAHLADNVQHCVYFSAFFGFKYIYIVCEIVKYGILQSLGFIDNVVVNFLGWKSRRKNNRKKNNIVRIACNLKKI